MKGRLTETPPPAILPRVGVTPETHDCWDHPSYYEQYDADGERHHGWDCAICGEHLQSG